MHLKATKILLKHKPRQQMHNEFSHSNSTRQSVVESSPSDPPQLPVLFASSTHTPGTRQAITKHHNYLINHQGENCEVI